MARKLRYEEEGGLYHVINRGNYRHPVFGSVGAAQAFEATLWETLKRYGWKLHAYVLMSNHYHLAPGNTYTQFGRRHALAPKHLRDAL